MNHPENNVVGKENSNGCCCSAGLKASSKSLDTSEQENNFLPTQQLTVDGASCGACVGKIKNTLLTVPNVKSASMDLSTGIATVVGTADIKSLISALEQVGFHTTAKQY
jgi:copper chaperone CopZ